MLAIPAALMSAAVASLLGVPDRMQMKEVVEDYYADWASDDPAAAASRLSDKRLEGFGDPNVTLGGAHRLRLEQISGLDAQRDDKSVTVGKLILQSEAAGCELYREGKISLTATGRVPFLDRHWNISSHNGLTAEQCSCRSLPKEAQWDIARAVEAPDLGLGRPPSTDLEALPLNFIRTSSYKYTRGVLDSVEVPMTDAVNSLRDTEWPRPEQVLPLGGRAFLEFNEDVPLACIEIMNDSPDGRGLASVGLRWSVMGAKVRRARRVDLEIEPARSTVWLRRDFGHVGKVYLTFIAAHGEGSQVPPLELRFWKVSRETS